jgi:hypothetical protein
MRLCRTGREATSDKPGGYVGQGGRSGVFICVNLRSSAVSVFLRVYSWLVLGANTLTMDSKMVSLAFL